MAANQELPDVRQLLVNAPRQATRDPDNIIRFDLIIIQQAQAHAQQMKAPKQTGKDTD